jgi:catechol 2,3-dioxygenase-like lactoylglutathione lyase family enzyme
VPPPLKGLRHVALKVHDLEAVVDFFTRAFGYRVEWRPDADNVYLTSGADNIALHRAAAVVAPGALDHLGLACEKGEDVDAWAAHLAAQGISPEAPPRTHRDGARSFYVRGPEGLSVQVIHHRPIS